MTPTQDTSETTRLYLKYINESIPDKVWLYGRFSFPLDMEWPAEEFVQLVDNPEEFLAFFCFPRDDTETNEHIFRLKNGQIIKALDYRGFGYFFDITDQVKVQSQISDIVRATKECLEEHLSIPEAMKVVNRTIRFEK